MNNKTRNKITKFVRNHRKEILIASAASIATALYLKRGEEPTSLEVSKKMHDFLSTNGGAYYYETIVGDFLVRAVPSI